MWRKFFVENFYYFRRFGLLCVHFQESPPGTIVPPCPNEIIIEAQTPRGINEIFILNKIRRALIDNTYNEKWRKLVPGGDS
ncbi:unnamed protein product [Rotaria sordida]|uniref:Uncharacterized protein n=1 Tax=Rotaria sordida TaxID=392033 RepID=A0A818PM92_9BILA|nr:unnamed protein product [Rotaria sordida]CAF1426203.1 unnamed protein product [Rotaria sordida]CAF3625810.1 unnamed protein product [Rotaria sordida]CAF4178136.1 unnamed protein product [Rotaria sordida]